MTELSPGALDVLKMATTGHNSIRLPIITDVAVYREVARLLGRLAGGSHWDRLSGLHVYHRDPRPELEALIGSSVIEHPSEAEEKDHAYWPTPAALGKLLVDGLGLPRGGMVLEPSAGDGQLVRAIQDSYPYAHITAVEPNEGRRMALRLSGGSGLQVWAATFEEYAQKVRAESDNTPCDVLFDAVVMNPPFALPGRRYAWAEHLVLAWGLLRDGGQLRAIVPASLEYGRQRPIAAARALIGDAGGSWRKAPDGAFHAAGTGVHTLIVEATR